MFLRTLGTLPALMSLTRTKSQTRGLYKRGRGEREREEREEREIEVIITHSHMRSFIQKQFVN